MNKEQFLAMSLPHKLYAIVKYLENREEVGRRIKPVTGYSIEKSVDCGYFTKVGFFTQEEFRSEGNLLYILHPLSDLTKPIEHKGEKFMPQDKINELKLHMGNWNIGRWDRVSLDLIEDCPLCILLKLIEWHFDIAGLIEKREAIDVNTLPENPYK